MMSEAIKNFAKQFAFEPIIENGGGFTPKKKVMVAGMGGSALAAGLLKNWNPDLDLFVHKDYGLPHILKSERADTLLIASSYSGNTEETLDAYMCAGKQGIARVAVALGGKLLEAAKKDSMPYIQIPDTGIQPRSALGFSFKAHLRFLGLSQALKEVSALSQELNPSAFEEDGKKLAEELRGHVPVIYSSARNESIAYNWKIKFNETGKIPAFYNMFPELNHNEMTGFDVKETSRHLSEKFFFIFLRDRADHPRTQKRAKILERLYRDRGLSVRAIDLEGVHPFYKIFSSLVFADWTALYIAQMYALESEQVPMVEEFKKLVA